MRLAKLKVKNTFIDIDDSDDETLPAMCPVNSAPVKPTFSPPISPAFQTLPTLMEETPQQMVEPVIADMPTLLTSTPRGQGLPGKAENPPMHKAHSDSTSASTEEEAKQTDDLPETLLVRNTARLGSQQMKVKNTFIDGVESDDDEDRPQMMKRLSMPCRPKVEYAPPTPTKARQGELLAVQEETEPSGGGASVIEPLHLRNPGFSKGGQLHGTGHCKPCAWYWRPQGCANGEECGHCHFCSAAELKARKKAKKSANQRPTQQPEPEGPQVQMQVPVTLGMPNGVPPGAILVPTIFVQQN